jgi:vitamin B12 transporter
LIDGVRREISAIDALPLGEIARVEIMRGAASARYGDSALGGVILITSRRGENARFGLRLGLASFGTTSLGLEVPIKWTNGQIRFSFSRDESDGGWLFPGQVRESADGSTTLGGSQVRALNTGYLDWKLRMQAEQVFGTATRLSASAEYLDREAGVAGTIDAPTLRAAMRDTSLAARLGLVTRAVVTGRDSLETTISFTSRSRQYQDFALYQHEDRYDLVQANLRSVWSLPLGMDVFFRSGIELDLTSLDALVAGGTDTTGRQTRNSLAVFSDFEMTQGLFVMTAALRAQGTQGFASRISPALGLALNLSPSIRIQANAGTAWRIPALDDLFWPATAFALGNDNLRPEKSWSADLGMRVLMADGLVARVTGFLQHSRDLILWQPSAGGVWRPGNIGQVLSRGLETSLEAILPLSQVWRLEAQAEYSLQANTIQSEDSTDGCQLPRTPHEKAALGVTLRHVDLGSLHLSTAYTGFRYLTMGNTKFLGDHLLLDLALVLRIGGHFSIRAAVKNIFDTVAVDLREYPIPGREWSLTWEAKL